MDKTLYMIGNAHIDPVWLWRWQDGFSEIRATFRSALDRMKEYPGFIFTSAAASYYAWIEQNDSAMFEEIRQRVQEGRWAIVGGWWIQPDCNVPSGESFARQALYGQLYFQEKFGVMARTGYNVDSFGHSGMLPKILQMCGMDRYIFMRPGSHEMAIPAPLFTWESPEGISVTAFRLPYDYCSWGKELQAHIARYATEIRDARGGMCFYGVGNHGGGPTQENLDSIAALDGQNALRLILSSPDAFFEQAVEKGFPLPVVNGDLLHHASGCYAVHSGIKQWNRRAENRLITAEKWCALANLLLDKHYPRADLTRAWKKVLFNQFHDILAGTSLLEAYEDARQDYGFALSVADEHINDAQQALMRQIDIPFAEGDRPFVVFNPQGIDARWPVALECASIPEHMECVDEEGRAVPYQLVASSTAARGRVKLIFVAHVPALGYKLYRLRSREGFVHPRQMPIAPDLKMENPWIEAAFSSETGALASLLWKPSGTQMLREETTAQVICDESDTWSHAVLRFDHVKAAMKLKQAIRIADGPVCATVRVVLEHEQSILIQEYTLYHELPQLFVRTQINWQGKQEALKLRFAMPHNYCHVTAQGPFGYADRPANGEEFPMQQWVDLTGLSGGTDRAMTGLAILNDAKYSYDVHDRAIHLTLLRSPYYAHHVPFEVEQDMAFPVVDQGWQDFTYVLMPHDGAVTDSPVDACAMLLNAPPEMLPESFHNGPWQGNQGFVSVEQVRGGAVALDALKVAEDEGGDLIVHLHETARKQADIVLVVSGLQQRIPLHFLPGEIKAVRITRKPGEAPAMVNLLEQRPS